MLMFYISCTTFGVVLNVFNLAANMGLYAARGVKPFQMNIIDPAAPADPAVVGAVIVAIISIWFFTKTYRRLSQEYSRRKIRTTHHHLRNTGRTQTNGKKGNKIWKLLLFFI